VELQRQDRGQDPDPDPDPDARLGAVGHQLANSVGLQGVLCDVQGGRVDGVGRGYVDFEDGQSPALLDDVVHL
jgi:hypothetical protein